MRHVRPALAALAWCAIVSAGAAQDGPQGVGQEAAPELGPESALDDASSYAFLAAPTPDLNRMFRVDRSTGEVGVCQFAVRDRSVGVTLCLPPGEGAGPQQSGDYDLVASNHRSEAGVFRVDRRTGRMSVCYVLGEQAICTPMAR